MAKLRLKADCGSSYLQLGVELDVDVPDGSPQGVKAAAGPLLDALREVAQDGLSRYRTDLAGCFSSRGDVPELEHKQRRVDDLDADDITIGVEGGDDAVGEVKGERCYDCSRLNTSADVIRYSKAHFNGKVLCMDCQRIRRAAATPVMGVNGETF